MRYEATRPFMPEVVKGRKTFLYGMLTFAKSKAVFLILYDPPRT